MRLLDKNTPICSRELIAPWRLASLGVGLLLLIMGSFYLPSADWDIPICFVMGIPAYVLAPWSFRQVYYLRLKWMPLAAAAFWLSIDGMYWLYWGIKDPELAEVFRWANFIYCTPIFWLSGFIWNLENSIVERKQEQNVAPFAASSEYRECVNHIDRK